jgi:hypothetical protein
MLNEVIDAQKRNFEVLNVSAAELEKIQTKTKFLYARYLLQHGEKQGAIRLARESWRGANSNAELVKFCGRLFIPMFVVDARRKLKKGKFSPKAENPET